MLSKSEIKSLEEKFGFRPRKNLGQNFLIDGNIKSKLLDAAGLKKSDVVLEIGPGLGQLTLDIAAKVKHVIAVEFDKNLFFILSDFTKGLKNVKIIREDFLKSDFRGISPSGKKVKVISNLPYYISTPIIAKLLEGRECIESAVLTLQKEAAERLTAAPSSKEYGSLTLFTSFYSTIKRLFNIKRNSFYPVPQVDSTVILLTPRTEPPVKVRDEAALLNLIRTGFSSRRKTLVNALSTKSYAGLSKDIIQEIFQDAGISADVRAEALSLQDFARISDHVSGYSS